MLVAGPLRRRYCPTLSEEAARRLLHDRSDELGALRLVHWRHHRQPTSGRRRALHARAKRFAHENYTQQYAAGPVAIDNLVQRLPSPCRSDPDTYMTAEWTGDAQPELRVQPRQVGYARYSRGYKAGGFQADSASRRRPSRRRIFHSASRPETVDNYEVGFKPHSGSTGARASISRPSTWTSPTSRRQMNTGISYIIGNAVKRPAKASGLELELARDRRTRSH